MWWWASEMGCGGFGVRGGGFVLRKERNVYLQSFLFSEYFVLDSQKNVKISR